MRSPGEHAELVEEHGEHAVDLGLPRLEQGERRRGRPGGGAVDGQEDVGPEGRGVLVPLVEGHPGRRPAAAAVREHTRDELSHQWLVANNCPETIGADVISVSELTHKLFADEGNRHRQRRDRGRHRQRL